MQLGGIVADEEARGKIVPIWCVRAGNQTSHMGMRIIGQEVHG